MPLFYNGQKVSTRSTVSVTGSGTGSSDITVDQEVIEGSENPVSSNAVVNYLTLPGGTDFNTVFEQQINLRGKKVNITDYTANGSIIPDEYYGNPLFVYITFNNKRLYLSTQYKWVTLNQLYDPNDMSTYWLGWPNQPVEDNIPCEITFPDDEDCIIQSFGVLYPYSMDPYFEREISYETFKQIIRIETESSERLSKYLSRTDTIYMKDIQQDADHQTINAEEKSSLALIEEPNKVLDSDGQNVLFDVPPRTIPGIYVDASVLDAYAQVRQKRFATNGYNAVEILFLKNEPVTDFMKAQQQDYDFRDKFLLIREFVAKSVSYNFRITFDYFMIIASVDLNTYKPILRAYDTYSGACILTYDANSTEDQGFRFSGMNTGPVKIQSVEIQDSTEDPLSNNGWYVLSSGIDDFCDSYELHFELH